MHLICWLLGGPGLIITSYPCCAFFSCYIGRYREVEPEPMSVTREGKNPQVAVFD
jgi:hypothetical protein